MAQVVKDGMGIENEEAFALALLLLSESNEEIKQLFWGGGATGARNRRGNKRRDRGFALSQMEELSDDEFRRMFRLSRPAFDALLEKISDDFGVRSVSFAECSNRSRISPKTRLAVTLRWLAGGSYLDICFAFGVAFGSYFVDDGVLWGTMEVIDRALALGFPFDDDAQLEKMAEGFAHYSHQHMTGAVLAIDGWVCRTRKPQTHEVLDPMAYRN